jgi:hypothetical protein
MSWSLTNLSGFAQKFDAGAFSKVRVRARVAVAVVARPQVTSVGGWKQKNGTMSVPRTPIPWTTFPRNGTNNFSPNDFSLNYP